MLYNIVDMCMLLLVIMSIKFGHCIYVVECGNVILMSLYGSCPFGLLSVALFVNGHNSTVFGSYVVISKGCLYIAGLGSLYKELFSERGKEIYGKRDKQYEEIYGEKYKQYKELYNEGYKEVYDAGYEQLQAERDKQYNELYDTGYKSIFTAPKKMLFVLLNKTFEELYGRGNNCFHDALMVYLFANIKFDLMKFHGLICRKRKLFLCLK